jgi:hypothetical protein
MQVRQSPQKKVSLLLVQTSSDITSIDWFIQFQLFRSTIIGAMAVPPFIGKYVLACDPWDVLAPINHMTCRTKGHHTQRARANASATFAIEMWRAAMVLLVDDHTRLSVPLDIFLLTSGYTSLLWRVVSDASPWRLAAGLYDYESGRLLCWTTLLLPYSSADAHRLQTQRKYLGYLLSVLLIVAYKTSSAPTHGTTSYQWVNDNTGAIVWVNANKCSSLASSFACMAVSQLNMLTDVWAADANHIPGRTWER